MNKPTIYMVQSGLGKTYFCQHNLGWADLDLEFLGETGNFNENILLCYINNYLKMGYKILTGADKQTCDIILKSNKYNVVLIIADKTMKEEILNRVKTRNYKTTFTYNYINYIQNWMNYFNKLEYPKIYLHSGQYLSDILNADGTIMEK